MKPVIVATIARQDILRAAEWHEGKREGFGQQFYARVNEALSAIELNPQGYAVAFEGLRRCNLKQFPYSLWFRMREDNSLVIACLSGKRDMRLVRERSKGVIEMPGPK